MFTATMRNLEEQVCLAAKTPREEDAILEPEIVMLIRNAKAGSYAAYTTAKQNFTWAYLLENGDTRVLIMVAAQQVTGST